VHSYEIPILRNSMDVVGSNAVNIDEADLSVSSSGSVSANSPPLFETPSPPFPLELVNSLEASSVQIQGVVERQDDAVCKEVDEVDNIKPLDGNSEVSIAADAPLVKVKEALADLPYSILEK
jgi:hypothetical protein